MIGIRFWSLAVTVALLAGCGGGEVPLAEVTGMVTFNGRPANAEVIFEPQGTPEKPGGRASSAYSASDGTYRLRYTSERYGAAIATHRVIVRVLRPLEEGVAKSLSDVTVPRREVRVMRAVAPGTNRIHFAVVW